MRNFLMFAEVVVAILLILVVVLQSSKSAGMGGAVSGAAVGGKARGIDGLLSKCTIVLGIVFAILSLFLGIYLNQY
ncbi:preprotein translocase subunit SecG [Veillonella seminalis]|uniref:preprotein translocase subunit SecG n=1 Tax=Veillonella seminalis TaxID=1502943 RepID=UPI002672EA54|nr:preprotein translocase subunit SecG [Veillonella seminalis]